MTVKKKFDFVPIFVIIFMIALNLVVFRKFVFQRLLPIPSDIITGVYYPWLNQKWGTITGVPVKNPLPSDIPSLVYPWRLQVRNQIFSGHAPLWNDQIFSGMPLLGNFQSSVFSLGNVLFLWIKDSSIAWSLGVFFQPILLMASAFIFFQKIKFSKIPSLLGGVLFALNGFSVVWLEYNLHGWVLLWLPLMLYAVELITEKNKWGNITMSVSVAGSILSGYPQLTLYSFFIVFIYSLVKLFSKQLKFTGLLFISLFAFLGVTLSAVQLLPGFETAGLSIRNVDTVATSLETRFLPIDYLSNLFAPDIHGNPATGNYSGKGYYDNFSIYIGIVCFVLSLLGFLSGKTNKEQKTFSVSLILIGIILSTPNPIGLFVGDLNLFGIKSIAARAMTLSIFGLIVLAVSGLENISRKILLKDLLIPAILTALLFLMFFSSNDTVYRHNLYLPLAAAVFLFTIFFIGKFISQLKKIIPFVLLLAATFETTRFANKYLSFTPKEYLFPETQIIKDLKDNTDIQNSKFEFADVIPENMWVPFGFKSAGGYDATAPIKYSRLLGMVGNKNFDHPQGRVGKIDQINKISDLIGVNYIFALSKKDARPDAKGEVKEDLLLEKFKEVFEEGPVKVFSIAGSAKTLDFYPSSYTYSSDLELEKIINSTNYDPSLQALVKDGDNLGGKASYSLKINEIRPSYVRLSVDTNEEGYIVYKQNLYPGWKVFIDGKESRIYEADYAFMSTKVTPGIHEVNFVYQPDSYKWGVIASSVSLLILLILVFQYKKTIPVKAKL